MRKDSVEVQNIILKNMMVNRVIFVRVQPHQRKVQKCMDTLQLVQAARAQVACSQGDAACAALDLEIRRLSKKLELLATKRSEAHEAARAEACKEYGLAPEYFVFVREIHNE